MNGKVIFTENTEYELDRIKDLSKGYNHKYYVYGEGFKDPFLYQQELSDFVFIPFRQTLSPNFTFLFVENSQSDFFVLKSIRFCDLMDRNVEMYQTVLKGYKLIVDSHPFLGKSSVFWLYFPWSFFNKTLLGYPHSYAFRDTKPSKQENPYDCSILAKKIAPATETTMKCTFEDLKIERIALNRETHDSYQELKKHLFKVKKSPFEIIKSLKDHVNNCEPLLKKGLKLLYPNKTYGQYQEGERRILVSNAKVDLYLESEFLKYACNVNTFMETLWHITRP